MFPDLVVQMFTINFTLIGTANNECNFEMYNGKINNVVAKSVAVLRRKYHFNVLEYVVQLGQGNLHMIVF